MLCRCFLAFTFISSKTCLKVCTAMSVRYHSYYLTWLPKSRALFGCGFPLKSPGHAFLGEPALEMSLESFQWLDGVSTGQRSLLETAYFVRILALHPARNHCQPPFSLATVI